MPYPDSSKKSWSLVISDRLKKSLPKDFFVKNKVYMTDLEEFFGSLLNTWGTFSPMTTTSPALKSFTVSPTMRDPSPEAT
jgi:hypothetical protein